ncbi:hypothetical protein CI15_12245 [Paraburkholderia monticola]|uniref:Uncharacterized protein n=1 Tax=Paraburkholderia monticola TaxID=1399968 RepID=A0A149PTD6_9BURK|nr:hypothetical protein CI15_12245 [Paraburkholderia monticola]
MARSRQRQIARLCGNRTGIGNPNAVLVAHQGDPIRIHAAELRDVDRDGGRGTTPRDRCRREARVVDIVRASSNVQRIGVDRRVSLHRSRQEVDFIDIRGVEARSLDRNRAAGYAKTGQVAAAVDQRITGGENTFCGINEAATVDNKATRIGDHDRCRFLSGDFEIPSQAAWIVAVDLVDDNLCSVVRSKIRIAGYLSRELGVRIDGRIIEDRAARRHVKP